MRAFCFAISASISRCGVFPVLASGGERSKTGEGIPFPQAAAHDEGEQTQKNDDQDPGPIEAFIIGRHDGRSGGAASHHTVSLRTVGALRHPPPKRRVVSTCNVLRTAFEAGSVLDRESDGRRFRDPEHTQVNPL
jgi:hypothetical protein